MIPPELLNELSLGRTAITRYIAELRESLDFSSLSKRAIRESPSIWLGVRHWQDF